MASVAPMTGRTVLAAAIAVAGIAFGSAAGATAPPDDSTPSAPADDTHTGGVVGAWNVVMIGSEDVSALGAFVEFTDDGEVQGFGGVNSFHGPYTEGDGSVEFGAVAATLMAGPEPAMQAEQALLNVLSGVQPVAIADDVLIVGSGDGAVELHRITPAGADSIVTINGTVTYRERIALPPDAVVIVQVNDVSVADAPAVLLAETTIVPTHQVPIPYAIAVSTSAFEAGHTYSLSIRISVGDQLLFVSDESLPVTSEPAVQTTDVVLVSAGS